jgi:hypothetical protein
VPSRGSMLAPLTGRGSRRVAVGPDARPGDELIIGRDAECAAVARLLAGAAADSAALVLSGEPSIGKSALCALGAARAGDMRVLRVSGVGSEVDVPFAGLSELCAGEARPDPPAGRRRRRVPSRRRSRRSPTDRGLSQPVRQRPRTGDPSRRLYGGESQPAYMRTLPRPTAARRRALTLRVLRAARRTAARGLVAHGKWLTAAPGGLNPRLSSFRQWACRGSSHPEIPAPGVVPSAIRPSRPR